MIGKKVPSVTFRTRVRDESIGGPNPFRWEDKASSDYFDGKRVVLFSLPGAFTPTCHVNHLPGFVANAAKLRAAGVDRIVCVAVNDHHVMKAWAEASGALDDIAFIADGNGELAEALGLDRDFSSAGLGTRYARAAMIITDGVVDAVFVEDAPGVGASGAPAILLALEAA